MAGVITTVAARLAIKKDIIEVVGPGRALADPPELRRSVPLGLRLLNRASMLPQSQLSMMAGGTSSPLMEDVPVFRDASETVMSRKPHTGSARRNCTLDELQALAAASLETRDRTRSPLFYRAQTHDSGRAANMED